MHRNAKTSDLSRADLSRHNQCRAGWGYLGWSRAADGGGETAS